MGPSESLLKRKSRAINTFKNKKGHQATSLTLQLKELGREEQTRPRASRRKELINIRTEISEMEKPKVGSSKRSTKLRLRKKETWFKLLKSEMKVGTVLPILQK